jgi:diguanylate cyclase (GGDEF)-like protein
LEFLSGTEAEAAAPTLAEDQSGTASKLRHELRNRAAVVAGLGAVVVEQLDEDDAGIGELVTRLASNAQRLESLVAELDGNEPGNLGDGRDRQPVRGGPSATPLSTVLIVEDDSDYSYVLECMLTQSGAAPLWNVVRATSLADACRLVRELEPICTLVDLNLPDASALLAPEKLRAVAPEQPIVVVTGDDDAQLGIEAVRRGAQDYLVKGRLNRETLNRVIRYAIERRRLDTELTHQALHCPLTGVANRTLFLNRLELALARLQRNQSPLAVAFIDLDDFHGINQTYGHVPVGDEVLISIGRRLTASVRRIDTVARYGGDEFVVLREQMKDDSEGEQLAKHLSGLFRYPFTCAGVTVPVTASIGVAVAAEPGISCESVLQQADATMFEAKRTRGSTWKVFRVELESAAR